MKGLKDPPEFMGGAIDEHPDIVWLRNALEEFPHLDSARARQLLLKIMMRHGRLQVDAEIPTLETEERAWSLRVLERYESLMPSRAG